MYLGGPEIKRHSLFVATGLMILLMSATTAIAGVNVSINDDIKQPLKMVMLEPWYRQTVYSTMPIKTLKLELCPSTHIKRDLLERSSVSIEVLDSNNVVVARFLKSSLRYSSFPIRLDIPINHLSYGRYLVIARVFDSAGKSLTDVFGNPCEAQTSLFKAPPAVNEVVFDQNAICRVNGKPFFPIAMYHYEPGILTLTNGLRKEKGLKPFSMEEWYLDARKMGINAVHDTFDWNESLSDIQNRCDLMHRVGLRALIMPIEHDEDRSSHFQLLSKGPGLLGWYTYDEPQQFGEGFLEDRVAPKYKRLLEIDPYHPQFICDCVLSSMIQITPFADVLMPDVYPGRGGDMRILGKWVAALKSLNDGRTVVWPVIQAFNVVPRWPGLTYEEMRVMVFDSVACGATGISYYAYYTSEGPHVLADGRKRDYYMLDDYLDQRQAIIRINQQLEKIIPAIVSGKVTDTSIYPHISDVHTRAFNKGGKRYVLVANPGRQSADVKIGIAGMSNQTGRDLYSSKNVQLANGFFSLNLKPLAVNVFVF